MRPGYPSWLRAEPQDERPDFPLNCQPRRSDVHCPVMFKQLIRLIERQMVFFPERALKGTPDHVGLGYEDLWLNTSDGVRINAWWIPGACDTTVMLFHGNGGNISARLDGMLQMNRRLGVSIMATEYRGYGLSDGVPSETGTYLDALAALKWVKQHTSGPVVYFGVSMGGAVAAWLAARHRPDALVLESAPSSLPDVAHIHAPWTRVLPTGLIMQTRYETSVHVAATECPVLVIHGDEDDVVPYSCGGDIYKSAKGDKSFYTIHGGGHDRPDRLDEDSYYAVLKDFLDRHTGTRQLAS